jgi:hypothetical protein
MLLLGCAGSSNSPSNQQAANGQQPQAGSNQQPAQQQQPGGSVSDAFLNILGMKSTLQYRVAYSIISNAGGQQTVSQMTQYMKGTDKLRMDSSFESMESRTYLVDGAYYSCSSQQGTWTCMKITIPADDSTTSMDDVALHKDDYQITADGTMQVAGVTAACYRVTGKSIEYSRSCYSPEGVPLYVKMTSISQGGAFDTEMEATSYSTSVSDSDFALPATATALPSVPSSGGMDRDACESACSALTGDARDQCEAVCPAS